MATRSRIAIENQDGSVSSIYCHFDGYPQGVGATLRASYSDKESLQQLLNLGDIRSLGDSTATTVAYYRDIGESLNKPRINSSLNSFAKSDFEEFGYVLTLDGRWSVFRS